MLKSSWTGIETNDGVRACFCGARFQPGGSAPTSFSRSRRAVPLGTDDARCQSSIEETAPLGPGDQGPYLNQMVLLDTDLSPRELLRYCHEIEDLAGRVRGERWGARTLDLDIVRFGDRVERNDDLVIPHPEISNRIFWQREIEELELHVR